MIPFPRLRDMATAFSVGDSTNSAAEHMSQTHKIFNKKVGEVRTGCGDHTQG